MIGDLGWKMLAFTRGHPQLRVCRDGEVWPFGGTLTASCNTGHTPPVESCYCGLHVCLRLADLGNWCLGGGMVFNDQSAFAAVARVSLEGEALPARQLRGLRALAQDPPSTRRVSAATLTDTIYLPLGAAPGDDRLAAEVEEWYGLPTYSLAGPMDLEEIADHYRRTWGADPSTELPARARPRTRQGTAC